MFRKKVLIVGGAGFIGSHVRKLFPKAEIMDLRYASDILQGIPGKWDVIIFLAANMGKRLVDYNYNEHLYEALDEYMKAHPKTHVIYTSSAAVYPDQTRACSEWTPPVPANLYGQAKLLGECYVQQYKHHSILRLSNVYGKDGKGAWDLFSRGERRIYGDGSQVRDYIPVSTVAKVIREAVQYPRLYQGITNVSTGLGITTKDLFYLNRAQGAQIQYRKARLWDVQYSVLDNSKLEKIRGY